MIWDDLRKLLTGPQLYRLDGSMAVRLLPIFYALGLAAIVLWAIDHLVVSFALSFSQGLWGILEIIVFGPLMIVALRIVCEWVLVFFKAHEVSAAALDRARLADTLLEEVSDAIHDLAEDDDRAITTAEPVAPTARRPAVPEAVDPLIKRTTRRSPRRPPPTP